MARQAWQALPCGRCCAGSGSLAGESLQAIDQVALHGKAFQITRCAASGWHVLPPLLQGTVLQLALHNSCQLVFRHAIELCWLVKIEPLFCSLSEQRAQCNSFREDLFPSNAAACTSCLIQLMCCPEAQKPECHCVLTERQVWAHLAGIEAGEQSCWVSRSAIFASLQHKFSRTWQAASHMMIPVYLSVSPLSSHLSHAQTPCPNQSAACPALPGRLQWHHKAAADWAQPAADGSLSRRYDLLLCWRLSHYSCDNAAAAAAAAAGIAEVCKLQSLLP